MTKGFYELTPHDVLNAVERSGFVPTGELNQLNSYENRVFDVKIEALSNNLDRIIAKFYRPGRWGDKSILDEHKFLKDLNEEGISAVAPLVLKNNRTLDSWKDMYISIFPKIRARMVEEFLDKDLENIGYQLARVHNVGARTSANHRKHLTTEFFGWESLEILENWIAPEVLSRYLEAGETILLSLDDLLDKKSFIRIHGDCHRGNLLKNTEFFFVDFDDFCNGPVAQDIWMLLSGDNPEQELEQILTGYEKIRKFDPDQIKLFEPLRGLRIIYYARWIATRWEDPSFPRLFPNFKSYNYWAEETEILEKIAWTL